MRLLSSLIVIGLVFAASRVLVRMLPGDPLESLVAETGTSISIEELKSEFGLDRPIAEAILKDFKQMLHGDWGRSLISRQPIAPLLKRRFLRTLGLTLVAFSLSLVLSLTIGLLSARDLWGKWSSFCSIYGAITAAFPTPWLGPILIYFFAVRWPVFPLGGHLALPSLSLALVFSGLWARLIRAQVSEALTSGFAQSARARGISEWKVIFKYGLIPSSGALVAYLGTQLGALLAGAVVTEVIFDWKGMGSLLVDSVLRRDYPVIEAAVFIGSMTAILGTWLGDFFQQAMNPRIRGKS
jgi:peptide/nickel transport system permease protein